MAGVWRAVVGQRKERHGSDCERATQLDMIRLTQAVQGLVDGIKKQTVAALPPVRGPLPSLTITGERDLPPQVELNFETSDEDFERLLGMAMSSIPALEQHRLLVGELIRQALIETVERMNIKLPEKCCGNCEWYEELVPPAKRKKAAGCCRDAEKRAREVVPFAVNLSSANGMPHGGKDCPMHRYHTNIP